MYEDNLNQEQERISEQDKKLVAINGDKQKEDLIFWRQKTVESFQHHSLIISPDTPPYKSFDPVMKERFFIQKCTDQNGKEVVAKVSSPEGTSKEAVNRESQLYQMLDHMVAVYDQSGQKFGINFPHKVGEFQTSLGQVAIVTDFVTDEKDYKKMLTPREKTEILIETLQQLHKLPIPQEILSGDSEYLGIIGVERPDQIPALSRTYIHRLLELGVIGNPLAERLQQFILENIDSLNQFFPRIAHGDLHMENIALSLDRKTGERKVTLMDIEALKVSNEFYDIAHIANRIDIYNQVKLLDEELPGELRQGIDEVMSLFEDPNLMENIKQTFITNSDAERAFRLMRVCQLEEELYYQKGENDEVGQIKKNLYPKLMAKILEEFSPHELPSSILR